MVLQRAHVCPNCGHQLPQQYLDLPRKKAIEAFERDYFEAQLGKHRGNVSSVARATETERSSMFRILRRLGLRSRRDRGRPSDLRAAA